MRQGVNALHRNAAEEFTRRVTFSLGERIDAIVLYGSAARGEAKSQSDVDILVISPDPTAVKGEVSTLRSDLVYDNNFSVFVSLVHLSRDQFWDLVKLGSPFANDVLDVLIEGVVLYDNGTFSRLRGRAVAAGG